MYLKRFYDEKLAHASYLVGCQAHEEAIVIDPSRDIAPYLEEAQNQGLKIVAVTETHVHADYLSGSRQLAHETGAKMYLSKEGGADWQYEFKGERDELVGDGDEIKLGNLTLEVMHTPGHTPEHISFILTDHPASDEPIGVFTGDFLFVGDVGRPDLLEKAAGIKDTMRKGAAVLYKTIERFKKLPDHLQIWPAHGAGSACGKALGAVPSSVLGYEKMTNWAFQIKSETEFVEAILEGQPEPPKYFAQMKKLNKVGPPIIDRDSWPEELDSKTLAKALEKGILMDLRSPDAFAESHPKGSLHFPQGSHLVTWAGWLLPYDESLYLLLKSETQLKESVRALQSIGLDQIEGYFTEAAFKKADIETQQSRRLSAEELDQSKHEVLDVRSQSEWDEGHLEGAKHIHLGYLTDRMDEVPDNPILYCGSGVRSLIASSLLQKAGKEPVDIVGGYAALANSKQVVAS